MTYGKKFVHLYFSMPDEIKIIIMEFNSEHRCLLKKTFDDIQIQSGLKRVNQLCKIYNNDFGQWRSFAHLLNDYVNDKSHLFNCLSKCNCCSRHRCDRPFSITTGLYPGFTESFPTIKDDDFYDNNCQCKCRHTMRHLCRTSHYSV